MLFRLSIINRKKSPSERDLKRYEQLDALKEKLVQAAPYTLIQVDDEAMGISSDDTPDRKVRSKDRSKFIADLGFNFPIGVFTYERYGTLGKWYVCFRMEPGHTEQHHEFVSAIVEATKEAPTYLSLRQTNDAIDTIARATGKNKRASKAILSAVLPDGTIPYFQDSKGGKRICKYSDGEVKQYSLAQVSYQ